MKKLLKILSHSTFWGWNLIFIIVAYCGILPFIGIPLIAAAIDGDVPWDFCLTFFTLIIIPPLCTAIAAKSLRSKPQALIRFFYGVEAPIFTWCLVRLFLIRELTWASIWVLGTLLICILAFAREILERERQTSPLFSWLQMLIHTLILLMGVYLGLVLLFYAVPVAFSIVVGVGYFIVKFFSFQWIQPLWEILTNSTWLWYSILSGLFLILFGFSSTLFVGMPFTVTGLYIHSGQKILRAFARQYGKNKTIFSAVTVISLWLILLFSFNQQPQVKAFELLARVPENRTELIASSEVIRKGLINANLYPYRYLSTKEDNNHIYSLYNNLGLPQRAALFLQHRYNQLLSPFLYNGSHGDIDSSTFYGSIQIQDMLQQFQLLRNGNNYDAVFLISNEGSYELAEDKPDLPEITSPLWLIHLGGQFPKAYDDATLQVIQNSNGGVADNLATAIKRLATENVLDGYTWTVERANSNITNNNLKAIAARQLVFNLAKSNQQLSLAELDTIHQIAKDNAIVTPYSSIIVLVNDEQKELLKQAEAKTDRFEREIETGVEQLDKPFNPFEVSGVPEPDIWILLAIVSCAFFLIIQRQKTLSN